VNGELRSAEQAAERTIQLQQRTLLIISAHESEEFVNSLLNAPEAGAVLQKAARRYKKVTGADR
jgi:uncharacterized protein (DUF1778 family)